jgi:Flp pilus assembly protein TadD
MRALRGARHYATGSTALERSQTDRAVEELERAAVLIPHASEIQNHLGLAYWSAGRRVSARAAFERAIELDCENRAAEANLAGLSRSQADVPDSLDAPSALDNAQRTRDSQVGIESNRVGRQGPRTVGDSDGR